MNAPKIRCEEKQEHGQYSGLPSMSNKQLKTFLYLFEVAFEVYGTEQLRIPKRRNIEQGVYCVYYTQRGRFNTYSWVLALPYKFYDDFCTPHR